ncbi:hypothetical protein [Autumnicola psychrophila]|uniref:Uncharacterized protein n=1 Tax=Autumnicola psychrophila TaxID=3075592 RepID=A0ABU3DQS0_9FLAO|nr:hypothetical protein [Zunongwangia sp. F225]MDT0686040.1 hypothetical protein [Zunongwangia sp. F225]
MKTLIFSLVLLMCLVPASSQETVGLSENTVSYAPYSSNLTNSGDVYSFSINEIYNGEFELNPLTFMKKNFDVNHFILELKDKDLDACQVSFVSRKGMLKVDFDKEGKMVKMYQRFRNIKLPNDLSHEIYRDYKGWNIVKSLHIARGRDGRIDKEFYRLKLENGNKTKIVRIDRTKATSVELAIN